MNNSKLWALLIGVNFYPDDDKTKSLEGCVSDVQRFQKHLASRSQDMYITALTASRPNEGSGDQPPEGEAQRASLDNVRASFELFLDHAKAGDLVHIHFSGHGVRRPTLSERYGDREGGDVALVLYDPVSRVQYLQGWELASWLKRLVERGLRTLLVLDCCFSGSVIRQGHSESGRVRAACYDPTLDARSHYSLTPTAPRRDATILPDWLINPQGYAILTACGPEEKSKELTIGREKTGALTHFLLHVVNNLQLQGKGITFASLHQHLSVQFYTRLSQQIPRRYGNADFAFFNMGTSDPDPTGCKVYWSSEQLLLDAGDAHGVSQGDEYMLRPVWQSDTGSDLDKAGFQTRVATVAGLSSTLERVHDADDISIVRNGWHARALSHLSPRNILIAAQPCPLTDKLRTQIRSLSFLTIIDNRNASGAQTSMFKIVLTDLNQCVIVNEQGRQLPGLGPWAANDLSATTKILDILDHIAKFIYIRALYNRLPAKDLESAVQIEMLNPLSQSIGEEGRLVVKHKDEVKLRCKNLSQQPLYLSIYNLRPSWDVVNIFAGTKFGEWLDLLPNREALSIPIEMSIPLHLLSQNAREVDDVFKVFVTTRPIPFSSLSLPALLKSDQQPETPVQRGHDGSLLALLRDLSPPLRGKDDKYSEGQWLVRTFVIHVALQDNQDRK